MHITQAGILHQLLNLGTSSLQGEGEQPGASCDLQQPPGVTDVSVLEMGAKFQCGRGFWEISRCSAPSSLFFKNRPLGVGSDWADLANTEQMAGWGGAS